MLNISLEIETLDYFFNFFGIFLVYLALKKEIHWYSLLLSIVCSGILAFTTHYIYGGLETIILILVLATVIFSLIRFKKVKDSVIFFVLANIYVVVVYCIVRAVIYILVTHLSLPDAEILLWAGIGTWFFLIFTVDQIDKYRPIFSIFYPEQAFYNYKLGMVFFILVVVCFLSGSRNLIKYNDFQLGLLVVTLVIFLFLVGQTNYLLLSLKRNKDLLKQQQRQADMFATHFQTVRDYYQEIVDFKHDYKNMLQTLSIKIHETKNQALIDYFQQLTDYSQNSLKNSLSLDLFEKIELIESIGLQGIVFSEIAKAQRNNVNVLLSITDKITDFGPLELVTARILSIILDNAIDETKKTPNKQLELGFISYGIAGADIIVRNTVSENTRIDLDQWLTQGYSTKGSGHGRGLTIVQELINQHKDLSLQMFRKNNQVSFILRIEVPQC